MGWAIFDADGFVLRIERDVAPQGEERMIEVPGVRDWPQRPGKHFKLKVVNGALAWVDPRPLDTAKLAKNAEINAARLAANRSYFMFAGKQIACDELSRSDIDGVNGLVTLTQALPPGWPGGWKAIDNTYVAISDVTTWVQFYAAMVAQGTANFAKAQMLKAQLASATTLAEVEAIQW